MFNDSPPRENSFVNEIMWTNIVEPGWSQMTMWYLRWIPKATNAHSVYVILIAFSW
jgi:hypothetical protein